MQGVDWIAVDWGTTCLRAWAMQGRTVLAEAKSDRGMNTLSQAEFEPALLDLLAPWLSAGKTTDVICCGMVGSRQGWIEAPYASTPCAPLGDTMVAPVVKDPRISVRVISGVSQSTPADVMRGEETQIAGFLALNDGWDGVICLPGTHTKWVHVSAGEIVSFQTFMTGEMFALLSDASVLRHSVATMDWDDDAFDAGVSEALSKPETLAARLFRLRADHLLHGTDAAKSRSRLSGLLIGAELAATRPFWLGQQLAVIGADALSKCYTTALSAQGLPVTQAKVDAMTLAGLYAAAQHTKTPA